MRKLECFGEFCPIPILRLIQALKEMGIGEQLMLVVDHSCVQQSVEDYFKNTSHRIECNEVLNGVWEITVTKGSAEVAVAGLDEIVDDWE